MKNDAAPPPRTHRWFAARRPSRPPRSFAQRAVTLFAVGYPLLLMAVVLVLRFVGERTWVTTVALYLPRWPFAAGALLLLLFAMLRRNVAWLAASLLTLLIWAFPLAGLQLGHSRERTPEHRVLRVLSYNVDSNRRPEALLAEIRLVNPDLFLLQEARTSKAQAWWQLDGYHFSVEGQFILGSRFPIAEVLPLPRDHDTPLGWGRAVRYRVTLPETSLVIFNVHPPSPRLAFRALARDVASERAEGTFWPDAAAIAAVSRDAAVRADNLRVVADEARQEALPVIVAGDTNLPDLSPVLAETFGGMHDAFLEVGLGFGYTFPNGRSFSPWMRLDRILTNDAFRTLDFRVLAAGASDHRGIVAELELLPPP